MVRVMAFVIICICFLIFMRTCWIWQLNRARRKGTYPPPERSTLFDVKDLLQQGEKELAVRLYCEIYQTNPHEARKAVEEMERNLKP